MAGIVEDVAHHEVLLRWSPTDRAHEAHTPPKESAHDVHSARSRRDLDDHDAKRDGGAERPDGIWLMAFHIQRQEVDSRGTITQV